MAGHCSTLLQHKFLQSSLFVDQGTMSSSFSSNSTIEDATSVHRSSRQYMRGSSSVDCHTSTGSQASMYLANEARFSVDERLFLSAALDEGGASVAHHRWQQASPLVTLLNASQRSLRSVDSCPEMPRRGEESGRIVRTNSIDMASRFLARQERQAGPRDGGKSFYLNMMASNQNNSTALDIDLYRPVGFNLNEIRRRRSLDTAPAMDLHKPVGLPIGLDMDAQRVKMRRHSFDLAPSLPTRSAPDSPASRSKASSTRVDKAKALSCNQVLPAIQIAKKAQQSISRQGQIHQDDESTISSEEAADDVSVASSQESDIITEERDMDDLDLDDDCVDIGSSMRWESRPEDSNNNQYDSGSESDLSDEDYRPVRKSKERGQRNSHSSHGDFSGKRNHSSIQRKPEPGSAGSLEHNSPSPVQTDPIEHHRTRPRHRRARSSEHIAVNSSTDQDVGKKKWRECLERSKARRNARSFDHAHARSASVPSPSTCT